MKNFLLYSILFLSFLSCKENSPTLFSLTVNVTPENTGFVTPSADTLLEDGTQISLMAEAVEGYNFTGWSGALSSIENPLVIEITEDLELTANFEIKTYSLITEVVGNGQVTETVVQPKTDFDHGTLVRLEAIADTGWVFVGWTGDVENNQSVVEILVESELNIVANFEIQTFPLNISIDGNGSVFGLGKEVLSAEYTYDTELTIIGKADSSWIFKGWTGDFIESSDTLILVFTKEINLNIRFVEGAYLNIEIFGNGEVTPVDIGMNSFLEKGTTINLEAIPDTTWVFRGWNGDIVSEGKELELTLDSDVNLTMLFEEGVLDFCVPINLTGYRYKSEADSVEFMDWKLKYDGRFIESYSTSTDFSGTGNFSKTRIEAELTYEDELLKTERMRFPQSSAMNQYTFSWSGEEISHIQHITNSNIYSRFESTRVQYEEPCGLTYLDGEEYDSEGVLDGIYKVEYLYSNNCNTYSMNVNQDERTYSNQSSIFKDVAGMNGLIGGSYLNLISFWVPIPDYNKDNKRLMKIANTAAISDLGVNHPASYIYEYSDNLFDNEYPTYINKRIVNEDDKTEILNKIKVKYYCGYK